MIPSYKNSKTSNHTKILSMNLFTSSHGSAQPFHFRLPCIEISITTQQLPQ